MGIEARHGKGWVPTGELGSILTAHSVPLSEQEIIARRAGRLAGTPNLPFSAIERALTNHPLGMAIDIIGAMACSAYKKLKR